MYINKLLSSVSVSSNSIRSHNRINGVHRKTFSCFHLFLCRYSDRNLRPSLSHSLSSIWALVVLFGLILLISPIKYYFRKYGTLPNRSGGLNIRLDYYYRSRPLSHRYYLFLLLPICSVVMPVPVVVYKTEYDAKSRRLTGSRIISHNQ